MIDKTHQETLKFDLSDNGLHITVVLILVSVIGTFVLDSAFARGRALGFGYLFNEFLLLINRCVSR